MTTTSFDSPTGTGVGRSREAMDYLVKSSSRSIDLARPEILASTLLCLEILWQIIGQLFASTHSLYSVIQI